MDPLFATRRTLVSLALSGVTVMGGTVVAVNAQAGAGTMVATTNVNVRSGPGTNYRKLGQLRTGQTVRQTGSTKGWAIVVWNKQKAYVSSQYLRPKTSESSGSATGRSSSAYTTANVNVRTGPGTGFPVVAVLAKGSSVALTGKTASGYSEITHSGHRRWVSTAYVTASKPGAPSSLPKVKGQGRATTALMLRTTADASFRSLGDIPRGTIVDLTGVNRNGMAQIVWKGQALWVNARYITPVSGNSKPSTGTLPKVIGVRYATTALDIRTTAGSDSKTLSEVPRGTKLSITGTVQNGRAQIVHTNAVRWVTAKYLSTSDPSASSGNGSNSGSGDGGSLNRGWSSGLDQINDDAKRVVRHVWANYPAIKTMYGWRRDVTPDHPAGRAVDVMIPSYRTNKALGWEIANYFRANAQRFNLKYIIFDQQIWNIQRDKDGWRRMSSRGSDTANHLDHVHINTW